MPLFKTTIGVAAAVALLAGAELKIGTAPLVTHEWGTFTSVAREDGAAVEWAPLLGPGDLPCFVTRARGVFKSLARGLVRMETPVLYFYTQRPTTLSVHIDFPQGIISEWYPNPTPLEGQVGWNSAKSIDWKQVRVTPGPDLEYPVTEGSSHYYAARNTDSAPLRIGNQQEKMIFYRGLGNFAPPLLARYKEGRRPLTSASLATATAAPGRADWQSAAGWQPAPHGTALEIRNAGNEPIPFVIAFENQRGRIGYRIAENVTGSITLDAPELTQDLDAIRQDLVTRLTKLGLYPKEALAMVNTWADSWFTEGARVFYIVPRATVDSLLPLTIVPSPTEVQRVFVGRLEVLSPWTKDTIEHALRAGDDETLSVFGRFLEPFITQIQRADTEFVLSPAAQRYLRAIAGGGSAGGGYGPAADPASCVE